MSVNAVARELRAAREALGLTREQLAEKIGYAVSYIEKIETGKLNASASFVDAAASALAGGIDATGLFDRLRQDCAQAEAVPAWFRPWVDHEQEATEIRWFEPLLVPGLLQVESYAGAVLDGDADRVAARLKRQAVLGQAAVAVIIEESVLRRRVGDAAVMAAQLQAMVDAQAVVQVLPATAGTYLGTVGSFALATVDGAEIAYADTPLHGLVSGTPRVVWDVRRRWDELRGEALPRRQSRELILKEAERWRSGS